MTCAAKLSMATKFSSATANARNALCSNTSEAREDFAQLLQAVRSCTLCAAHLPQRPRPVLQASLKARILIAGQAPGKKVDLSGIPFDDASGDRLRQWLGLEAKVFYDPDIIAILPMGFCYPGRGRSGDLPPRPECAPTWRKLLLEQMPNLQLTLAIGQYAQAWHLQQRATLTETVRAWRDYGPVPLPHPSPRNNLWLRRNPWFEEQLLPPLRARIAALIAGPK